MHTAQQCAAACHRVHNVPDFINPPDDKLKLNPAVAQRYEVKWLWTEHFHNAFPGDAPAHMAEKVEHMPFLVLCNHCAQSSLRPGVSHQGHLPAGGRHRHDGHAPLHRLPLLHGRLPLSAPGVSTGKIPARTSKNNYPGYPTREIGVVEKCTFCAERLAQGLQPACVEASGGAMVFGDLEDEKSEVREYLRKYFTIRRKAHLGTNPQVYYIV